MRFAQNRELHSIQKDSYIAQARTAREVFLDELLIYRKTEAYQAHVVYTSDFKAEPSKKCETKSLTPALSPTLTGVPLK